MKVLLKIVLDGAVIGEVADDSRVQSLRVARSFVRARGGKAEFHVTIKGGKTCAVYGFCASDKIEKYLRVEPL